ncbi:rCG63583 [Rattus norvegicus]|uniref:RCG63583 n=1 Tax=Rattus norvegicus TaxID=10116 RepID=A6IDJ4_RAT|nr:rCG63583 [Rattus norvegicus]
MLAVCAKTSKHSFLLLDDCTLRLLTYRDLFWILYKPSL